jgi:hypothetical protein
MLMIFAQPDWTRAHGGPPGVWAIVSDMSFRLKLAA